jgi:alpha-beta hydrolase superfamily lysophospholipase
MAEPMMTAANGSSHQIVPVQLTDENSVIGAGGDRIYFRRLGSAVDAPENPRAVVVLFHGIQSHCSVDGFRVFADEAAKIGLVVYGRDQRGHGYSEGTRMYMNGYKGEVDEAETFVRMITAKHPSLPFFLYG